MTTGGVVRIFGHYGLGASLRDFVLTKQKRGDVMTYTCSRRTLLGWVPLGVAGILGAAYIRPAVAQDDYEVPIRDYFPSGNPKLVADTVLYAHSSVEKVAALVAARPALSNANIDWGFGDWESAIGAASHTGRRDVADVLLEHGARPDIFTHAMLGHVDVIRAIIEAQPGIQRIAGPHGITLMAHARAGKEGAESVVDYLGSVGGADKSPEVLPLLAAETAYVGTYRWGSHENDILTVEAKKNRLSLKGARGFGRTLFHVGDHTFRPAGAPSVRISFRVADKIAIECKIYDAELMVLATRKADG